jgi:agmatinase
MPLLDAPVPRMAGRLSFMRAARKSLDDVRRGDLVIIGLPLEDSNARHQGQTLAPRGLRETSVYFGWHANAQFSHPVDVNDRRRINTSGMFDRMGDLGDLDLSGGSAVLSDLQDHLSINGVDAIFLGGNADSLRPLLAKNPVVQLGGVGRAGVLSLAPLRGPGVESDPARSTEMIEVIITEHIGTAGTATAVFDLSVFATHLSGLCDRPRLGGSDLPEVARWLTALGKLPVSSVFLTGLNPTLSGMGVIKTGQRLMVTALLRFVYARLGAAVEDQKLVVAMEVPAR